MPRVGSDLIMTMPFCYIYIMYISAIRSIVLLSIVAALVVQSKHPPTRMDFENTRVSNAPVLMRNTTFSFPLDSSASSSFEFPQTGNCNPNHSLEMWLPLYQNDHLVPSSTEQMQSENDGAAGNAAMSSNALHHARLNSEATSVTTRALQATSGHLCVNGATAKVSKKRSRASRRAPTTLLSTDTSNFRAMVQQFTGIPHSPFSAVPPQGPLLGRSFPPLSYNTLPTPQQYSSFLLQDDMNSAPFFFPRAPPSQGGNTSSLNDGGLNPAAAASLFSSLTSEGRPGYLI